MASGVLNLSNSESTSGGGYLMGKIEWSSSPDIEKNQSQVPAKLFVKKASSTGTITVPTSGNWDCSLTVNGKNTSSAVSASVAADWVLMMTVDVPVAHNTDGTRSIEISGSVYGPSGTSYSGLRTSGTAMVDLDTIPRATTPSLGNVVLGGSTEITLPRASDSFTHTLLYYLGSASGEIANNVGASYTWNAPLDLVSQIPAADRAVGRIVCKTFSGDTLIGTSTVNATFRVPDSLVPTISSVGLSKVNDNDWAASKGLYIQGFSKVRIQTSATPSQGSEIAEYSITSTPEGISAVASEDWTSDVLPAGSRSFTIQVRDRRDRAASKTSSTIQVLAYSPPVISSIAYERGVLSGGNWTASNDGAQVRLVWTLGLSLTDNGNTADWELVSSGTVVQSGSNAAAGTKTLYTTIGTDETVVVTVNVTDKLGKTASRSLTIATVKALVNENFDLMSVAFGKIAEKQKTVEIAADMTLDAQGNAAVGKDLSVGGAFTVGGKSIVDLIYPVGAFYISAVETRPEVLFGGEWTEITGRFLLARSESIAAGSVGGESEHTLSTDEMPSHGHNLNGSKILLTTNTKAVQETVVASGVQNIAGFKTATSEGGGKAHNNMPPYLAVYMWQRVA